MSRRYQTWMSRGAEATRTGDFRAAIDAYLRARADAEARGAATDVDRARLNLAMVRIQIGEARLGEEGLREILLRSTDSLIGFSAAYNLSSSLRKQGRHERAISYARRAMERARALGDADFIAPVHNLMGNIYLNQNFLDQALAEYKRSLALRKAQTGDTRYSRAILEENIGYCLLLQKKIPEGLRRIGLALELATDVGDRRCRAECLQDLCYGHLIDGAYADAVRTGGEALAESTANGFEDIEENCHYLLGELGSRTNDLEARDRHFDLLQRRHPELPFLKDFLCEVDVTDIITLKR